MLAAGSFPGRPDDLRPNRRPARGDLRARDADGAQPLSRLHARRAAGGPVAITLWALLASDRFSRRRETALAGALLGLATLTKTPAPLFLAGPAAVMLIGGGWRQWRNQADRRRRRPARRRAVLPDRSRRVHQHLGDDDDRGQHGCDGGASLASEPRFSFDNLAYYGKVGVNLQYFVPLLALLGWSAWSRPCARSAGDRTCRSSSRASWSGTRSTLIPSIRDPRYTLPLVVYVAVIGTGWPAVSRRAVLAALGAAVLAGAVVVNAGGAIVDDVPSRSRSRPRATARPR